jgi:hypothetical protein
MVDERRSLGITFAGFLARVLFSPPGPKMLVWSPTAVLGIARALGLDGAGRVQRPHEGLGRFAGHAERLPMPQLTLEPAWGSATSPDAQER